MWTGKRFLLKRPILAVALVKGPRTAEYILNGQTVGLISGPGPSSENLVEIRWKTNDHAVFAEDLETSGVEASESPGYRLARHGDAA